MSQRSEEDQVGKVIKIIVKCSTVVPRKAGYLPYRNGIDSFGVDDFAGRFYKVGNHPFFLQIFVIQNKHPAFHSILNKIIA